MKSLFTIKSGSAANWALRIAATMLVVAIVIWIPTKGSNNLVEQSTNAFVLMGAAMALNLLLGFTGQISIGHSAFFGIGAYSTAIMVTRFGWNPWHTFMVGFVIAFVVGMLVSLPALRIKGTYLALVTLALGLVFPNLLKWRKLTWLTGGPRGLDKTGFDFKTMRRFEIFGWDPFGDLRSLEGKTPFFYWIGGGVVVITYLVCRGVVKSRQGRALIAIRDNETAAAVMGVNLPMTKALVFGLSAALCSLPGSLSALRTGNVVPDSGNLTLLGSIAFLIVMVIGGAGSLWGPIIGAAAYVFINAKTGEWGDDSKIPGVLRPIFGWAKTPPGSGIFATALVALMFVAPLGIVGLWRRHSPKVVRIIPAPAGLAVAHSGGSDMIVADEMSADEEEHNEMKGEST